MAIKKKKKRVNNLSKEGFIYLFILIFSFMYILNTVYWLLLFCNSPFDTNEYETIPTVVPWLGLYKCFLLNTSSHLFSESQNLLSWKGPTKTIESNFFQMQAVNPCSGSMVSVFFILFLIITLIPNTWHKIKEHPILQYLTNCLYHYKEFMELYT